MSDAIDPAKLKVTELRSELQARGLDSKGNKPVLVDRLREALEAEQQNESVAEPSQVEVAEEEQFEEPTEDTDFPEEQGVCEPQEEVQEEEEQQEEPVGYEEEEKHYEEEGKHYEEKGKKCDGGEEFADQDCTGKDKKHFEAAPVEDVADEDKSAVDLIKDDFFNGHTEELQGLEEEEEVKEEVTDVKEEVSEVLEMAVAEADEAEQEGEETWDHKRGRKRPGSPVKLEDEAYNKKSRPDADVCVLTGVEDDFDKSLVVLDWYNSDLSLKINKETRLSAVPLNDKSFAYMWHGVRATYGYTKGRLFFEVTLIKNVPVPHIEEQEEHPHVVRVGWSVDECGFTLGEEPRSWGYGGTGKASTNLKFKNYGCEFKAGDVIGAYLDLDVEPVTMSYTVNGDHQGIAYEIRKAEIGDQAIFPHVLTKNIHFSVNFGTEASAFTPLEGYTFASLVPLAERVQGSQGPSSRDDCEVLMMVGLPACGKTTWVQKYCSENRHMKYNVLGTNDLIDKMKVQGMRRKRNYSGRWDQLISSCTKGLNHLLYMAYRRPRNYIIDQTNVYPTAQKRKMRGFAGCKRRAVVLCPTDEDLKLRTQKREKEEGKDVPDSAVLEMKANFKLPDVGEFFDSVEFVELEREEAQKLIELYNKEGQAASDTGNQGRAPSGGFGGRSYNDRGGRDNRGQGNSFRGGWDRDRDRRGGYDRRDRGGGNWNRNNRDFGGRLGAGSGYNSRDSRGGGAGNYNRDSRGSYNNYRGSYGSNNSNSSYRDSHATGGRSSYQSSDSSYYKYPENNYSAGSGGSSSSNNSSSYSQSAGYGQGYTGYSQTYTPSATTHGYNQNYSYSQPYYGQQQQQSYYQQPSTYRTDGTGSNTGTWSSGQTTPAASSAWGQQSSWGAASAPAAAPAAHQTTWSGSTYQAPAPASGSWAQSSQYSGYNYGYKK